jgi:glycolate oxidase FAD binding subunit
MPSEVAVGDLLHDLCGCCGAEHVLSAPLAPAEQAIRGVMPVAVVSPGSVEELAEVMALTGAAGLAVVPVGGGTAQAQGSPPRRPFVAVRTVRLCRVRRYEPGDLTISIEAGATLAALGARLQKDGLMLPVDAPLPARATLGGILAIDADGPRRLYYGTLRDLLIGITVVEASGRISKAGGLVVKNVSGFDLMKLYLGSQGTLALIVAANFKLLPIPRSVVSIQGSFAGRQAAFALAATLSRGPLLPVAVEYLEGYGGAGPMLVVRAEGLPAATGRHQREVLALLQAAGAGDVAVREGPAAESLWADIADLPQTAALGADEVVLKICTLPAKMAAVLEMGLVPWSAEKGVSCMLSVRALCGVAYLRLRGEAEALVESARRLATSAQREAPGSRLSVLAAKAVPWEALYGQLRSCAAPPDPVAEDLSRRLHLEFDPQGRLNPGRVPAR